MVKFEKYSNPVNLRCKKLVWIFCWGFRTQSYNFSWFWPNLELFKILLRSAIKSGQSSHLNFSSLKPMQSLWERNQFFAKLAIFLKQIKAHCNFELSHKIPLPNWKYLVSRRQSLSNTWKCFSICSNFGFENQKIQKLVLRKRDKLADSGPIQTWKSSLLKKALSKIAIIEKIIFGQI